MTIKIQQFRSEIPGESPSGLLPGQLAYNLADQIQFIGYGGDVNYDINGSPIPSPLPDPGMGWRSYTFGGGQPGPEGKGVPAGGLTGQILAKETDFDYQTQWVDNYGPASPVIEGVVYGSTPNLFATTKNITLGFGSLNNIGTGDRNTAIGLQAGLNMNDVSDNVVVGYQAAFNIDGGQNVVLGSQAFGNNPGGQAVGNVGIGFQAGYNLTSGDYNTLIGYQAGDGIRTGSNNVIIGNFPGGSDWTGYVALADGVGNPRFVSNSSGAWSPDGVDFGIEDFVLTSQGPNQPPAWKPVPLGFVSQIIAGANISISPSTGTGVVTISSTGGGGGGSVSSIKAGNGLLVANSGPNPITISGELAVDFTKVVATSLYVAKGTLLYASGANTPVALPVGTPGQLLQVQGNCTLAWASVPGASPATPSSYGLVYGLTDPAKNNVALGVGSGAGFTSGVNNLAIGPGAGANVTTGSNNVFIGAADGTPTMSNNIVLSTGTGTVRMQFNECGAVAINGNYGLAGQVLTSIGCGAAATWVTPPNAPIQTITGQGITVCQTGTAVNLINDGIVGITASAPIIASTVNGQTALSAPNALTDLTTPAGCGIAISGTGNTRAICNTGVIQLIPGTNTTVANCGNGCWQVNSTGGGGGGTITSICAGTAITVCNPTSASPTINNDGVTAITALGPLVADVSKGSVTLSAPNAICALTAGAGVCITGSGNSRTICNTGILTVCSGSPTAIGVNVVNGVATITSCGGTGVSQIVACCGICITPAGGTGIVCIYATGGGGGAGVQSICSGCAICVVNGTSAAPTINNTGVTKITAGSNVSLNAGGCGTGDLTISALGSICQLSATGTGIAISNACGPNACICNIGVVNICSGAGVAVSCTVDACGGKTFTICNTALPATVTSVTGCGPGISVSPTTGEVVVCNTGVAALAGTTNNITVASCGNGCFALNIGCNVLTNVTAGNSGIIVSGTGNTRALCANVVDLADGPGIDVSCTNNIYTITNNGVRGISGGTNVTVTESPAGSKCYVISAAGGGGSGTVTCITTSGGITGGPITSTGDISVDPTTIVTKAAFTSLGSILYGTGVGSGFTALPAVFGTAGSQYLTTTSGGALQWCTTCVTNVLGSNGVCVTASGSAYGEKTISVDQNWLNQRYVQIAAFGGKGDLLVGTGASQFTALSVGGNGQFLSVNNGTPVWVNSPAPNISGVAPINYNGTNGQISFDTATTALTAYIKNSSFTAPGQMLISTGACTYSAFNAGSNNTVLSINNSGQYSWTNTIDGGTY